MGVTLELTDSDSHYRERMCVMPHASQQFLAFMQLISGSVTKFTLHATKLETSVIVDIIKAVPNLCSLSFSGKKMTLGPTS